MRFIKKLFKKEAKPNNSLPSWEEIVGELYGKQLNCFRDEVVNVIYSKDKSKRCVVLKNAKGIFTYRFERIYVYDEDELIYFSDRYPAMWEPDFDAEQGLSFFDREEELMQELKAYPYYKMYFA